ncbi:MAG TPA: glycosyltransferase family 2 protein [Saprospiraceae bacterium]|nr:glycosyltransferase family 2 protein [Saprospiraceae bacterium]
MTSNPLVSILMPVRNEGKHLNACIQSIRQQDYPIWELIAIDDQSTDDSWQQLQVWASKDTRIHVYQNKGKGIIDALKTGLDQARGEYVTRMDADDLMLPAKLGRLLEPLKDERVDISTGRVKYAGRQLGNGFIRYEHWVNNQLPQNFWQQIYYECPLPSPCWMCRIDLFKSALHDPSMIYPEDYFWAFWLYEKEATICKSPHFLHIWRDYQERTSRIDPNYADQGFINLKLHFFMQQHHGSARGILLLGAGKKGKRLAKLMVQKNLSFEWITNNPRKIGMRIYGVTLRDQSENLSHLNNRKVILAISSPEEFQNIHSWLKIKGLEDGIDIFRFY